MVKNLADANWKQKCVFAPNEVFYFSFTTKRSSSKSCSCWFWVLDLENISLKIKISWKPKFEIFIRVKKRKIHCLKKYVLALLEVIFLVLSKEVQQRVLQIGQSHNRKLSLKYEKCGKYCYIPTYYSASTLGWLT